jgi:prevent-host-death family protein
MTQVSAREAKLRFNQLLRQVLSGEEVVITQNQRPVAKLVKEPERDRREVHSAVAGLLRLRKQIAKRGAKANITLNDWKSAVEEGRR